jgi:hypothetical protein
MNQFSRRTDAHLRHAQAAIETIIRDAATTVEQKDQALARIRHWLDGARREIDLPPWD